jgi:HAE1 family hydrophobic/amphiphilic exporter-1
VADIDNIRVVNARGIGVRIGELGEVVEEFAPPSISRENRQRVVAVTASLGEGVALGSVISQLMPRLAEYHTPDGIFIELGGSFQDMQESFADIGLLLMLIIALVFIAMATQFESFVSPFIVMITSLLAFPGVILALWITNTPLSLMALIGGVMLVGIVVKNGIILVDFTNLLRERGMSISHAIVEGGRSRLRPVLMTSITTILGMLPLALGIGEGSELWQPMGIAVIGGLTVSTAMTLLAVPVMYSLFRSAGINRRRRQMRNERMMQLELAES